MSDKKTWAKAEVAEAMAVLNRIVMELFLRTQHPVENRHEQIGRLWVVEDAARINEIFDKADVFHKNFGLVATLGASRFNLNGSRWLALRGKTQRHYAKAGRPSMRLPIADIYRQEIESLAAPDVGQVETALARAALRVFFMAFDLTPDVAPFLSLFAQLRGAAAILQYRSWNSVGETDEDRTFTLERAKHLTAQFQTVCASVPEVEALIRSLAAENPAVDLDVAMSDFMTNMFAGIETTTASLGWMIDCLGRNAEIQAKVRAEVLDGAGETCLAAFRDECMRFFPPIPFVVREAAQDVTLGSWALKTGDQLLVSIVGLHRDPLHWTDPNGFHAARAEFTAGQGTASPSFRPFLSGPRACGGRRIAEMELTEALKILLRGFEFESPEADTGFQYSLAFRPTLTSGHKVTARR